MTYRSCATQEMIDAATVGSEYDGDGCSEMTDGDEDFMGFKHVTACLCSGNC